jgi:hypothetical protein
MAKSVLDKVRKFKNSRPKNDGNRSRMMNIYHDWQDGPNEIRLVGEFLEVRTHFIAPAPKRNERGLCQNGAFSKDSENRIPKVINCPDWDCETESERENKTCPICKLHRLAEQALKEDPNDEEKKYFDNLLQLSRQRVYLKWNIFDRERPNVTMIDENGNETKQKGLKIASIGMEAWNDIEGIFDQCGFDITDPDEGVDINVIKGHNGARVAYSAQVILEGTSIKVTPFDDEEKEIVANHKHDLLVRCGKQTDADLVKDALHGDYAEVLDVNSDDDFDDEPAPTRQAPRANTESDYDDDEDDFLGGTEKKK